MQHHREDITLEYDLLPITLSPGLGCLLGTYRIQIWSKQGIGWGPLQHFYIVGQICVLMLYWHKLLLHCVPQIFEHEYTRATNVWLYWVETALLVDRSDSGRCLAAIARASCCLFSVEQRLARASCCFLIIITSGMSESRFHNIYLNTITIILSVATLARKTLCLLWNLSWGIFLRFLHSLTLRERSYLHFHCSLDEHSVSESHTPVSIHTACICTILWTWQHPHTPVSFAHTNRWS